MLKSGKGRPTIYLGNASPFRLFSLILINDSHSNTLQTVFLWGFARSSKAKPRWLASTSKNFDNVSHFRKPFLILLVAIMEELLDDHHLERLLCDVFENGFTTKDL